MFGHETFIAIFFRFANFGVLIALGIYIFKKYAFPSIFVFMNDKQEEHERLEHQRADLEVAHGLMLQKLHEDFLECARLKAGIDEWRKKSDNMLAIREKDRQDRMVILYKKIEYREKVREQERVRALVAERVVIDLNESLPRYFEQKGVGSEYLETIIHCMEKDVS